MAKYTKIRENTFDEIQLNAGILLDTFTPDSPTIDPSSIIGATTGGVSFSATPEFIDNGEDIDNCPKNMMELKELDTWEIMLSGTYVTVNPSLVASLVGAADVADTKITPRNDLTDADFKDLWWVGDYSSKNGETNGGFVAIHMMNALSTGGFQLQTADKEKGQFEFEYTAHFSMAEQDVVPFEIYVKAGTEEA